MVRIGARALALWAVVALTAAVAAAGAFAAGATLPDGRRYELVSPVAKNGVEIIPQTDKHQVRPDGDAVTFSALGGFGSLEGSSLDFEYFAERTGLPGTSGWSTHGINPLARPVTYDAALGGHSSTYVDAFTSDLSTAIYRTWRPLVNAPNAAEVSNLYRITGLNGGVRTAQLLTDAVSPPPDSWFTFFDANGAALRTQEVQPQIAGASSDLSHVAFESRLNLTADAPPYPPGSFCELLGFGCPTKLYENDNGVVRLVGRIPQGTDASCDDAVVGSECVAAESSQAALGASLRFYSELAVSDDGRRIYFQAPADPGRGPIYVREDGMRTDRITGDGEFWAASADGTRAFVRTSESLLPGQDSDGTQDIYMYDADEPAGSRLTLVSSGDPGLDGFPNSVLGTSADGDYVYFVCNGQLIAGEPPAPFMALYVWHDGQLRFIGTFPNFGVVSPNTPRSEWTFIASARTSRITPDGRHLLFTTTDSTGFVGRGGFAGYDHAGHREFYLYDTDTGRLVCASCHPGGRAATADALIDVRDNAATSHSTSDSAQALSDDGRRVFFNTAEALVPEDTNGRPDAYQYDAPTGTVHLLSSGKSTAPSYFVDASPSGDDVFIVTRDRLVGWDVDDSYDLYDARVGGGFPEPANSAPGCVGESCLPAAGTAPTASAVGSNAYRGAGNARGRLRKHRRCGRRAVLRKVRGKRRCVRRRAHRRAQRAQTQDERSGR